MTTPRVRMHWRSKWENDPTVVRYAQSVQCIAISDLVYECEVEYLPQPLVEAWMLLRRDEAMTSFLRECTSEAAWRVRLRDAAYSVLHERIAWSVVDTAHLRGRELFAMSTKQFQRLLGVSRVGGVLIDIGAGSGRGTAQLRPLFDRVIATETSSVMARALRRCSAVDAVHEGRTLDGLLESAASQGIDLTGGASVVAALNVLEQIDDPLGLLRTAGPLLAPGGRLLLAVAMPHLGIEDDSSFEESASLFWERVIRAEGWRVETFARVPCVSQGDASVRIYAHDAAVFVLKPVATLDVISRLFEQADLERRAGGR